MKVDLFDMLDLGADCIVITTNGVLRNNGNGICGKGIAKQAKDRWDNFEEVLGNHLRNNDNTVGLLLKEDETYVCSFPTKYHWKENSSLELIEQSCQDLLEIVNDKGFKCVCMTKPGCGNGNLKWEVVKPILEKYFTDDRFIICDKNT